MTEIAGAPTPAMSAASPPMSAHGGAGVPASAPAPLVSPLYARLAVIRFVNEKGKMGKAARALGVNRWTLGRIYAGKATIGNKVASKLGLRVPETRGGTRPSW